MSNPTPARGPSRRDFATALALAALAPAGASAAGPKAAPPPEKETDPLAAAARALADLVRARHGKHLSDEQLKRVRASIHGHLASGRRMRRVKLANGDEPAFTFSAEVP
jgi:hypothetical protein